MPDSDEDTMLALVCEERDMWKRRAKAMHHQATHWRWRVRGLSWWHDICAKQDSDECADLKLQVAEMKRQRDAEWARADLFAGAMQSSDEGLELYEQARAECASLKRQLAKSERLRTVAEAWMNRQMERARAPLLPGGWGPGQNVSAAIASPKEAT